MARHVPPPPPRPRGSATTGRPASGVLQRDGSPVTAVLLRGAFFVVAARGFFEARFNPKPGPRTSDAPPPPRISRIASRPRAQVRSHPSPAFPVPVSRAGFPAARTGVGRARVGAAPGPGGCAERGARRVRSGSHEARRDRRGGAGVLGRGCAGPGFAAGRCAGPPPPLRHLPPVLPPRAGREPGCSWGPRLSFLARRKALRLTCPSCAAGPSRKLQQFSGEPSPTFHRQIGDHLHLSRKPDQVLKLSSNLS